jgi:hypothetical protein
MTYQYAFLSYMFQSEEHDIGILQERIRQDNRLYDEVKIEEGRAEENVERNGRQLNKKTGEG